MRLLTAPTILSVAVVATLLLPAGAIVGTMGSPTDDLFEGEPSVEMASHDGPNGEYVEAAEDGQLEIDFSNPGINPGAFTGAERVFDLVNTDTTNVTVWVTHDGDDAVTLYDDETGVPLESESSAIELTPGEVVTVSIDIDSTGATPGDRLLSTVTLHAEYDAELPNFDVAIDEISDEVTEGETVTVDTTVTNDGDAAGNQTVEFEVDGDVVDRREVSLDPGASEAIEFAFEAGSADADVVIRTGDSTAEGSVAVVEPTGPSGGTGSAQPSQPVEEGPTQEEDEPVEEEVVDEEGGVEVVFDEDGATDDTGESDGETDGSAEPQIQVRTVDVTELDTDEAEDTERPPQAVISSGTAETGGDSGEDGGDTGDTGEEGDVPAAGGPDAAAYDTQTLVNEPAELSGERSKIGAADGVTTRDRLAKLVDIDVPSGQENRPATVRMRVDLDRFGTSDPEEATIGHRAEGGWELLDTRVVDRTDEEIVLEARTPGFSMFATFSEADVTYEWELPDGRVLEGRQIDPTFEEPGFYDVQLTVTDRFGRQSTTTHRVLANDVPEATVEVVDREGDEVTLAANVDDELGDTEVTWTFPDGTEKTGEEVTHTLQEGEHEIGLHVVDEYGAESETEHTVAVGPPGASAQRVADALGMDLEVVVQMGLVSGIGLALAVGYRQFPWGILSPSRRRGPRITVFRTPRVIVADRQFAIEELTVEDPGCELDTVTIEIRDGDGRTAMQKRLDISGMTTYTARPETLTVPPGLDIDPEEAYTVRIKSTDRNGRSTERVLAVTVDSEFEFEAGSSRMQAV